MKYQPQRPQEEIRFTQNFLRDPALVTKLVRQANIQLHDTVLEIGPGKGIITKALAQAVGPDGQVIAVELDPALGIRLSTEFTSILQVRIISGDIMTFDRIILPKDYKVFANVPFNITSALLEYLFDAKLGPSTAHLILQTDTLLSTGEHGFRLETFKSLLIKPLYEISVEHHFKRSDFNPQPGVDTALFGFKRHPVPLADPSQYDLYKDFLAFVSKDRVGEGVWLRVLSRQQIQKLVEQAGMVFGRGMKMQSVKAITAAFRLFAAGSKVKRDIVKGAMATLRIEQARREQINRAGGHRRPRRAGE
jgi:23S rRNA (adenine-N6)-dimethyltransferase